MFPRLALLACLLIPALPVIAQDTLPSPSGQWQADEKQNRKLFKQADRDFRAAIKAHRPPRDDDGGNHGEAGPPPGMGSPGMGNIPGGDMGGGDPVGGPGGGPPPDIGNRGEHSLAGLLPWELAFAAPSEGVLIVQRMRGVVAFGHDDDSAVTLVPLNGDPADLGDNVKVKAFDEAGTLVLDATTPAGLHVQYRYLSAAATPGALEVQITINGHLVDNLQIKRVYRHVNVTVGAVTKP